VRVVSLAVLCAMELCAACARTRPPAPPGASTASASTSSTPAALTPADIAARSTPAIVTVRAGEGLGTGFIVRPDGWVVTNFHVVRSGGSLIVTLAGGREFPVVEIVAASRSRDLVVLRIDASKLPVVPLGDSNAIRPGDTVLAIGHPLGLEDTVSDGLVSAVRHVHEDFEVLQISAPIAPGSSGGPIFNNHGEVIGVVTAFLRSGQNLNFGVPSKYVAELMAHPEPISIPLFEAALNAIEREGHASVERHVPHHPVALLQGCTLPTKILIAKSLSEAIDLGAPLYNDGKVAACYHIYDGAAADLGRRLPATCQGPKRALTDGQQRAAKLSDPSSQAWAMRDTFDGLLELLTRSAH
jgi:hypothetical protein